ncbi:TetR/AcrR family transcriptional regulator [Paenibacillus azoreducens]|uniref:TetR/AcrR family transcriptional regulator n=1 Tax=Paenibacillus azoreducens TaxID=116718 RepID=A0A919YB32_9BACL|nr:TetR/AcrR family transcriptional regulator [Paenibacillus azoreducens]GIO47144.1 TetR/AcrR family transcriptional regulator [Paenibacillus azoreducens]
MTEKKIDPRIVRTRKLIMDAFVLLLKKHDFKDITIGDITSEATVNRATFYYHFTDKHDLLDKVLREDLMTKVIGEITDLDKLNEAAVVRVFMILTRFQTTLGAQCPRSFEAFATTIEEIIKSELERIFYQMLLQWHHVASDESLRIAAVMLSWGIYGASIDWRLNSRMQPEEYIQSALPFIMHGMNVPNG